MPEPIVPPRLIAEYDQAYADAGRALDGLVQGHAQNLDRIRDAGLPEATAVYALIRFLLEEMDQEATVSILSVAINRIHRAIEAAAP